MNLDEHQCDVVKAGVTDDHCHCLHDTPYFRNPLFQGLLDWDPSTEALAGGLINSRGRSPAPASRSPR